ncbi:hypothetical protein E2C01_051466 [Portunus trituberculatus]|uniref:Uncharacterized protein n=1 Tax=Portunus trituberculatus TaxID=210409 RepID=A0A5B7GIT1_PORTR|nr:hypothetical protein [Portunus trituberculatus]
MPTPTQGRVNERQHDGGRGQQATGESCPSPCLTKGPHHTASLAVPHRRSPRHRLDTHTSVSLRTKILEEAWMGGRGWR